jgi:hypothetical protein
VPSFDQCAPFRNRRAIAAVASTSLQAARQTPLHRRSGPLNPTAIVDASWQSLDTFLASCDESIAPLSTRLHTRHPRSVIAHKTADVPLMSAADEPVHPLRAPHPNAADQAVV